MKQALVKYTHLANKVMYATFARYFEYKKTQKNNKQKHKFVFKLTGGLDEWL